MDDDEDMRIVLSAVVAELMTPPPKVFTASTSAEALTICEVNPIDLVTTDIVRPTDSGLALAKELKQRYPSLPMIVVSGCCLPGEREAARPLGALYLQKPFENHVLLQAVAELTGTLASDVSARKGVRRFDSIGSDNR